MLPAVLVAQTGNLRGEVKDESEAVVPSAKVELAGPGRLTKSAVSDRNGSYSFSGLAPGSYSVKASAPSLSQVQPAMILVKPGSQTLDLHLSVTKVVEQVTVEDTAVGSVSTASSENVNALVLRGQNPFSPEFDKVGYGRIEIFTKPGTDRYHSTVNYNLGTRWWNSRNPYSAEKGAFSPQRIRRRFRRTARQAYLIFD